VAFCHLAVLFDLATFFKTNKPIEWRTDQSNGRWQATDGKIGQQIA